MVEKKVGKDKEDRKEVGQVEKVRGGSFNLCSQSCLHTDTQGIPSLDGKIVKLRSVHKK